MKGLHRASFSRKRIALSFRNRFHRRQDRPEPGGGMAGRHPVTATGNLAGGRSPAPPSGRPRAAAARDDADGGVGSRIVARAFSAEISGGGFGAR